MKVINQNVTKIYKKMEIELVIVIKLWTYFTYVIKITCKNKGEILPKLRKNEVNDTINFMFEFPCIVSLYYIRNQQDATLAVSFISHYKIILHVSDAFCVHHQEY